MDQKIDFHVRLLADQATRQAKKLSANLGMLNRDFRTNIRMFLIDNATRKLQQIRTMLASFPSLFDFTSKTKTSLRQFGHAVSSIFKNDGSKEWFEKIVGYFKKAGKWAMHLGDSLVGAFSIGGAAITAGIGVASAILSKQLIKINSEMEQFEVSLQTTLGSLTAAKQEMAGIVQFAKETPYEIKGITDAVVKLRAYSMDSGKWLEPLGNAASAFGRDITDAVEMAADAVQGMFRRALSYGLKMDKEDFKRGGKYAGMTYAEALMMELEKRFKGGMELQAKTLKGIWSNVKDSLYIQFQETTKPLFAVIKQQIQSMYEYLGSNEGQAKVKQLVTVMTDMLSRILEGGKKAFNFFKTTLLPIVQTTGKAMLEVFGAISDMVTPLLTAAKPLVIALASVLTLLSKLVTSSKLALQIFVGFSVAIKVMKLLGLSVGKLATSMVASGRAANMLSASIKTLGAGAIAAGVSFAAMWAIGNYLEIKNNLKEIGNEIHNMANSADEVKTKLKEIGEETGHTVKEMSKAALAAKQFGHNMSNVIEASARATSKAQEGFGKNLEVDADKAAEAIGRLAAAFIEENDTFEEMERKTKDAENMLVNLNRVADITGITFDDMTVAIEDNRDTLAEYADNVGELTFLLAEFGKAAKQAGIDANAGQFLDVLGSLLHPTKEMLLSLPSSTWIAKPLKDMDIDSIAESLSESLDATDIKSALVRAEGTAVKLVDASQEIRDNIEAGADYAYDKMKETAALYSAPGGGAGSAPGTGLGAGGKMSNFFGTGPGLAVELVGIATAATFSYIIGKRLWKKLETAIGVNRLGLGTLARNMSERKLAKELGKDFLPRLEKAQAIDTKNMIKDYKAIYKDLEKELAKTQKALDKLQLGLIKNPALRSARPMGMSAEEYVSQMMAESPEEIKKLTSKKLEDFYKGQDALEEKLAAIREKIAEKQLREVENLNKLAKSYDDLREAFKAGKIPENMRTFAQRVLEIGEAAKTAARELAKSGTPSKFGKGIMASILGALDFDKTFGNMAKPFKKGFTFRNTGTAAYGYQRFVNNTASVESERAVTNRIKSLTIGKYLTGPLFGKIKGLFGGNAGIISEGMQPGYFSPREGEQLRPWLQKIYTLLNKSLPETKALLETTSSISGKLPISLLVESMSQFTDDATDIAKGFGTQIGDKIIWAERTRIDYLKKLMANGIEMAEPVQLVIGEEGKLLMMNGHHRTIAALESGMKELKAEIQGIQELGTKQSYSGYIKRMEEALKKVFPNINDYLEKSKKVNAGQFKPGNKYAWTTETAPRLYTATKTAEQSAKVFAKEMDWDFIMKSAEESAAVFEKAIKDGTISFDEVIDATGKTTKELEAFAKELSTTSRMIPKITKVTGIAAIFDAIDELVNYFTGVSIEQAPGVGGIAKNALSTASYGFALSPIAIPYTAFATALQPVFDQIASDLGTYAGGGKMEEGVDMSDVARGEHWYDLQTWKSIGADIAFSLGRTLTGIGNSFKDFGKGAVDAASGLANEVNVRFGSLLSGGWGKMPEVKYSTESWGQQYAGREQSIEEEFEKTKDVAAREEAYRKLMDERVLENTQKLESRRAEILEVLQERIIKQYKITEDAGKASSQELMHEMARAAKYVEDNVGFGTIFDDASFSEFVNNFENGGTLAGHALAVSIDEALSNYDFSSAEGFKKFMQDMELGNVPKAFKDFFEGMDGGQLALTLTIEQLRKMQTESDALGTEIEKLSDEIDAATNEIAELEEKLNRLEVATNSVTAAFELGIARNELVLTSDKVWDLEDSISELGRQLSKAESEMTPLENALKGLQDEFQAIQDEIDKTQEKIDRLMNGPIEGEKAYQEERYRLEKAMKEREHELEKIQRENRIWDEIPGLSDSDLAKRARVSEKNLEYIIQEYKDALADLEYGRWQDTADAEHKRNILKIGEEVPVEDIMTKLEPLIEEKKLQESLRDIKGEELANQQALVDAKADEIANIQVAMTLKEQELENIKAQVAEANKLNERTKARADAEAEIERLKSQMIAIDALASKNALLQLAASGVASQEQLDELAKIYVDMVGEASALTNQKTLKGLELPSLQTEMANAQAQQTALIDKIETLVGFIDKELIGGVNIAALSKADLESLFGSNIGNVINNMAANIAAMAFGREGYQQVPINEIIAAAVLAANNAANASNNLIPGKAKGGIAWQKQLTWVAEEVPEAIIPLQNGSVPVKLLSNQSQDSSQLVEVNSVKTGDFYLTVRNDKDLEEVKKAIIELKTGDTSFFSSPHQYLS